MAETEDSHVFVRAGETGQRPILHLHANRTTTVRIARPQLVRVLELGPGLFRPAGAVPRLDAAEKPGLLDGLALVLARLREHGEERCLVAGHHPEAPLAQARAAAVRALLQGDRAALGAACQAHHEVQDWQALCKLAAQRLGWPCDPGEVDGKPGPRSKAALEALREARGAPTGGALAEEGDWGALLDLLQPDLARRLGLDAAGLEELLGRVQWTSPASLGCAGHWPIERARLRDYAPGHDERVDVLLFLPDEAPKLACHASEPCAWKTCDLYRKQKYRAERLEPTPGKHADVLELTGAYFNTASAQFLPHLRDAEEADANGAVPSTEERGLEVLVTTYRYLALHPDRALVVAGHTDTAGSEAYNQPLSEARAACVVALLEGDRAGFVAACRRYHRDEDDASVLRYVARTRGWPCDPGEAARATRAQIEAFQARYNQVFGASIAEDGVAGPQTWGAYFDVYVDDLRDLAGGAEALAEQRARLRWVDPQRRALGCGEDYPRVGAGVDGRAEQENRRVEVLFFEPSELPPEVSGPAIYGGDYRLDPLDLTGATYRAHLRLVDLEQRPLVGAEVTLHEELSGAQLSEPRTSTAAGEVLWEELPFDRYAVFVAHEGRAFSSPISLRGAESTSEPLEVVAPPRYRAHLRLVDADARPLAGASAQLFREDGAQASERQGADAAGEVRFDDLPLEEYVVVVEHEGREFSAFISLRRTARAPLEVVAPPRYRAHLRLVDADARPLAGASAQLFREDGAQASERQGVDAAGEVRFDDLPLEEYVVVVEHEGREFSAFISLRRAAREPLEVVAPPRYRAHLRLVDAEQAPLRGAEVHLCTEDGARVTSPRTADAAGEVRFDDLGLEEYVAEVSHGALRFSSPLSLRRAPAGAPCVLVAPPRHGLAIRCLTEDQRPVAGAEARLCVDTGLELGPPQATDADGRAAWEAVPPGDYVVELAAGGLRFSSPLAFVDRTRKTPLVVIAPEALRL